MERSILILSYKGQTPKIGENVFIAPTAVIIGDVVIGDHASVWFNAVIRGDMAAIRIGSNTNIQDNCTIHTDYGKPAFIGANVTVGHNAVLHGCTIEPHSLIGINAVVLNEAVIREGTVVASGSVVREGQELGPYLLVAGAPAVAKRQLTPEAARRFKQPVLDYLQIAQDYLSVSIQKL
jgi:carbonic anhydrase/acetyltransferase-like protein (isoleucine patch superfamily)